MNIEIEREKLERTLMLLAVATFHTPALQDERTELVEAGLKDLAAPVQEPVGALILGGVIDTSDGPEYEEWDVEWNTKAVEALQEKLVTFDSVTVMLYTTSPNVATPLAAQRPVAEPHKWVGLTDEERGKVYADWRWSDGRTSNLALCEHIEAKLKEKNT